MRIRVSPVCVLVKKISPRGADGPAVTAGFEANRSQALGSIDERVENSMFSGQKRETPEAISLPH